MAVIRTALFCTLRAMSSSESEGDYSDADSDYKASDSDDEDRDAVCINTEEKDAAREESDSEEEGSTTPARPSTSIPRELLGRPWTFGGSHRVTRWRHLGRILLTNLVFCLV